MVERIRTLLQTNQLTPTQFADSIGVARPIVSHILSGRNKPSLEVVQRIIAAFPAISLPWLLTGAGDMLAAAAPPALGAGKPTESVSVPPASQRIPKAPRPAPKNTTPQEPATTRQVEQTLFADFSFVPPQQAAPALAPLPASTGQEQSGVDATVVSAPVAAPAPPPTSPETPRPVPADVSFAGAFIEPGKSIRRIVIFYQDGTFTDYQPETKP